MAFSAPPSVLPHPTPRRPHLLSPRRTPPSPISHPPTIRAQRDRPSSSSSSSPSPLNNPLTSPSSLPSPPPLWRTAALSTAAAALATLAAPLLESNLLHTRTAQSVVPSHHSPYAALAAARFTKKSVSEKLSQVPVFAVTNASGQPYLAKMDGSGSQIGLIFFSHLDALNMLKDMQKNPGASDARVYIMGLDKAYEMVKAKPTPSGIRGSGGEEMTMVFRFYPDSKQVKAAEGLQRKMSLSSSVQGVPVFVAKGLTLRKGNENIVPLFLTKEDLDASWAKLRETNKHLPSSAPVAVGNLLYIIQQMETDEQPELRNLGFFAPRASVEYVSKEQAGPTGQARLHQNPVNPQNNK